MTLSIHLRHTFPTTRIDIAFTVASPGIAVLFGPSGSGKSTVITAAAGLSRPEMCRIEVDGAVLADTEAGIWQPPERRHIGMVFQDSRLFPHMSVASNLAYGMRRAGGGGRVDRDEVIDLLGIRPLLARKPGTLSGGERQRVAIGRALLAQPRLLLMDEPLASLDAARKAEILPFLTRLKMRLKLPILYVTHAMDELQLLADSVVLLDSGSVVASGALSDLAARADLPLARRDDASAVLACAVVGAPQDGLTHLDWAGVTLWAPDLGLESGHAVRLRLPAREVILATESVAAVRDGLSLHNILPGTVRALSDDAARAAVLVEVATAGGVLLSRVTPDAVRRLQLEPGRPVAALFKAMSLERLGATPPARTEKT